MYIYSVKIHRLLSRKRKAPRPRKNESSGDLRQRIVETAWRQIAASGAATLSLRSIARELEITAPAIYNYFPDRDALVTTLIIEAYTSLGDTQLAARNAALPAGLAGQLEATGLAYRRWALEHPQRYQLIFGTPIPGYHAPLPEVQPFAARSLSVLAGVVEDLRRAGQLNAPAFPEVSEAYKASFEVWKTYGGDMEVLSLSVAVLIWARVHGIVSLEIAGNLPPYGPDGDSLYRYELQAIVRQFIQ